MGENVMKRAFFGLALLSALLFGAEPESTQIYAQDILIDEIEQYPFVGIAAGYADTLDLDQEGIGSLRFGMQNNIWRTVFTLESNFGEYQALLAEVDRTLIAGLFGGKGRIYLGIAGGLIRYDSVQTENIDTEPLETEGYAYGGSAGFMYYLSDQIDLSVEYRYLVADKVNTVDHIGGPVVSLHYFF
jgi:hypothetical protein